MSKLPVFKFELYAEGISKSFIIQQDKKTDWPIPLTKEELLQKFSEWLDQTQKTLNSDEFWQAEKGNILICSIARKIERA
jgi:hypothetical protein